MTQKEEAWKAHSEAKKRFRKAYVRGDQETAKKWHKRAEEIWSLIGRMG